MKKIILIVPYFGKLPNYFQIWLNSCAKNSKIDWLLLTDDRELYNYPKNVKIQYISFQNFKEKIETKFGFKINLESSYKLCDYKPTYGYILEDLIIDYDYWGYCDIDLIFGDLEYFLSKISIEKYDKIFSNGHLTLFKNLYENNRIFKTNMSIYNYIDVYTNNIFFGFDESENLNKMFLKNGKKILKFVDKPFLDIDYRYQNLYEKGKKKSKWFNKYFWDNGKLYKYSKSREKITKNEYIYIHLQKRKIDINGLENENRFFIEKNFLTNEDKLIEFKKRTYKVVINELKSTIYWELKKIYLSLSYKKYILKKNFLKKYNKKY